MLIKQISTCLNLSLILFLIPSFVSAQSFIDIVKEGDLKSVQEAVNSGMDVNESDPATEASALAIAISLGKKETAQYLISAGANVNISSRHGFTPLMASAAKGWIDLTEQLLMKKADINAMSNFGVTPVIMAIWYGQQDVLNLLIKKGVNINAAVTPDHSVLSLAAHRKNKALAEYLINAGAEVNPKPDGGFALPSRRILVGRAREFRGSRKHRRTPQAPYIKEHQGIIEYFYQTINLSGYSGYTPLMKVIERGWDDTAQLLISKGADCLAQTKYGVSPLMIAVKAGNIELTKYLFQRGGDINAMAHNGKTPLLLAAEKGNIDLVKFFIENNVEVNPHLKIPQRLKGKAEDKRYLGHEQVNSLGVALQQCNKELVTLLIENGAVISNEDFSFTFYPEPLFRKLLACGSAEHASNYLKNNDVDLNVKVRIGAYESPLIFEVLNRESEDQYGKVKLLIDHGADLEVLDNRKNEYTPLMTSIIKGDIKVVEVLVKGGANLETTGKRYGDTALIVAVTEGKQDMVALLIEHGANINAESSHKRQYKKRAGTVLMHAMYSGSVDLVEYLLKNGADVNQRAKAFGYTAIYNALESDKIELVELVIKYGADVNVKVTGLRAQGDCLTPFKYIMEMPWDDSYEEKVELADLLLRNGADIRSECHIGLIVYVLKKKELGKARYLVDNGADLDSPEVLGGGDTPLTFAVKEELTDFVDLLIGKGANVDGVDRRGRTPLVIAVEEGHVGFVDLLINKGANVDGVDGRGRTPLMIAAEKGHQDIAEKLIENGANVNAKSKEGWTPYLIAKINKHELLAEYLVDQGADKSSSDRFQKVIAILLEKGLLEDESDTDQITPGQLQLFVLFLKTFAGIPDIETWEPDPRFSSPEKTWSTYRQALIDGDLELAEKCHVPGTDKSQIDLYKQLGKEKTREIAQNMKPIQRITGDEKTAKYRIKKIEMIKNEPREITYYIYFYNVFGEWRIGEY